MKEMIAEALKKATPDWHDNGNEIVSLQNPRVGIGGFLKEEDNHLAANSPEWIRWQNERIEQLEKALKTIATIRYDNLSYSHEDAECMNEIARQALGKE